MRSASPTRSSLPASSDRLPARLAVYGIEGENFETGEGLTPAVEATVDALVGELCDELRVDRP